jgi:hypothetical protein
VRTAITAKTLIKRLVINEDGIPTLADTPYLQDLPEWVVGAYLDARFFITAEDGLDALWIALPLSYGEMGVAIRAHPSSLLLYDEDDGYIHILAEVDYVGPYSRKGEEDDRD